jgi:hypothetical protein
VKKTLEQTRVVKLPQQKLLFPTKDKKNSNGKVQEKSVIEARTKENTKKKHHKNSLEVCFQFAFYAEARVPFSVLESRAKAFVVVVLVRGEAEKTKIKVYFSLSK